MKTAFDHLIELPAETYVDHMILAEGWSEFDGAEQAATPWISHGILGYHLGVEVDYRTQFLRDIYERFGGTAVSRVLTFSTEEVVAYWEDYDNQDSFGVYEDDTVLETALYYLSGRATDEKCAFLVNFLR